jgi:hypothetical protein
MAIIITDMRQVFQHLGVAQVLEGLLPCKSENLPQGDSKSPHITLAGEFALNFRICNFFIKLI